MKIFNFLKNFFYSKQENEENKEVREKKRELITRIMGTTSILTLQNIRRIEILPSDTEMIQLVSDRIKELRNKDF